MPLGTIEPFNIENSNFKTYIARLDQFFIINDVSEERKTPTLITLIGPEAYDLLVDICSPEEPAKVNYEQLCQKFGDHLQPLLSPIAERFKFRQRVQKCTESISQYVATLKKLARNCDFGTNLNENLRDQFVCGIKCEHTRQSLFTYKELLFDKAYEIAVNMESARQNSKLVNARVEEQMETNAIKIQSARENCKCCGRRGHRTDKCLYKLYRCKWCLESGHLQKVCPNKAKPRQLNYNNLEAEAVTSQPNDRGSERTIISAGAGEGNIYWINNLNCKPIIIPMNLDGKVIEMEIDTGSAISCISDEVYTKKLSNLVLKSAGLQLRYYTGETIKPLGYIETKVTYGHFQKILQLYIVKGGKTALLGRQWLYELQIKIPTLRYEENIHNNNCDFDTNVFIDRYKSVFADGIGCYNGGCVRLHVQENAVPVFLKARPLPFALKEKVDAELDLWIKDGIIEPVETSQWATPIVPVLKPNGRIRICADYKVTVNRVLQVDRYPLPTIDELMSRFPKGQKFSKIDLSQAYLQFCLDEQSKQFTVINTHKGLFKFNRLVFGLSSSPAIFQRTMSQLFGKIDNVAVFLDDILISGKNETEHVKTFYVLFDRLRDFRFKVNKDKCMFF